MRGAAMSAPMIFTATRALVATPAPRVGMPGFFVSGPVDHPVLNRGIPPDDFLRLLVAWGAVGQSEIFAENALNDIYGAVIDALGPFDNGDAGLIQRRAVMLEVLRVLGGLETSWNFEAGADPDGENESDPYCQETGIFQVSANSMDFDPSLKQCALNYCGPQSGVQDFIDQMKVLRTFAFEYCARLLRFNTGWDGPIDRGVLQQWVSRDAVAEFMTLITAYQP
jgi:hypothetical protein